MSKKSEKLFVVGIGASAGGLEPMQQLLRLASCHGSMCFIVASHVARYTENDLAKILGRSSNMTTAQAKEGMELENCKLFTIPPNMYVSVRGNRLRLQERPVGVPNNSVDFLFTSLAKEFGPNSIGVVLSGGSVGEDGAEGIKAIKKAAGHTYVQNPHSATFPGMPLAAIATGCADSVLEADQIGHELSLVSWAESASPSL